MGGSLIITSIKHFVYKCLSQYTRRLYNKNKNSRKSVSYTCATFRQTVVNQSLWYHTFQMEFESYVPQFERLNAKLQPANDFVFFEQNKWIMFWVNQHNSVFWKPGRVPENNPETCYRSMTDHLTLLDLICETHPPRCPWYLFKHKFWINTDIHLICMWVCSVSHNNCLRRY